MKHKVKVESFRCYLTNPNLADLISSKNVKFLDRVESNGWLLERGMEVKSTKYSWKNTIERFFEYDGIVFVYFKNPRVRNAFGKPSPENSDKEVQTYQVDHLFLTPTKLQIK